jgi:UDP-MurNAc hydroxylase
MQITFLGHAGFLVHTSRALIIMDAWVSPDGAFDGGWFQLPQNHFMAKNILNEIEKSEHPIYIYISHEHKDHFDIPFIKSIASIKNKKIEFVIPSFRRTKLHDQLKEITTCPIHILEDEQCLEIPNGSLKIYTDDSEMDRDSAILLKADGCTFLNLNDCKIFDRLPLIKQQLGNIDAFAVQFSGATWHPTCYDYSDEEYAIIAKKKMVSKFAITAKAIKTIDPQFFIPSAGPACFLDPATIHINFEKENIFPRYNKFYDYLVLKNVIKPEIIKELMPGDSIDVELKKYNFKDQPNYNLDFENYINNYAKQYEQYFSNRAPIFSLVQLLQIQNKLAEALQQKLNGFNSHKIIDRNLYIAINELPDSFIEVDFVAKKTEIVTLYNSDNFYHLSSKAVEFYRIINGLQTWEDFSLTFRVKLNRAPDAYQSLIHGFLILEANDIEFLCERFKQFELSKERMVLEVNNVNYTINRFCPHQGADLKYATIEEDKFIVCPRHGWRFDITNDGLCENKQCSINAITYEPE